MIYKFLSKTAVINHIVACCLIFMCSSCNDWLAVDMEDSIMEDKLFESNDGYMSALNGIYSRLNEQYSSTLSMGTIDVMAKLYNIGSNHNSYTFYNYNFTDSSFESVSGTVWSGLYSIIANINTLLEHCDEDGNALRPQYANYIKGETLALRAMLHLDLLRIYGPSYSEDTSNTICMPYQATSSKDIQPMLTAKDVAERILDDLKTASSLLENDLVRTEGVMNSDSDDPNESVDFRYRQYRLNYYAVQGLLARLYLWIGDKQNAYATANAVIQENLNRQVFPWTSKGSVQGSTPDRVFSSEVLFGLYNVSRSGLYDRLFNPSGSFSSLLTFDGTSLQEGDLTSKINWFYQDVDDLRRTELWSQENVEDRNENTGAVTQHAAICFRKYADVATTRSWRYMIPLLRMSELYLIAAECAPNVDEGLAYVNEIRRNRNCINLTLAEGSSETDRRAALQTYIDDEFAREVIGEGQLYFFYKRRGLTSVLNGTGYDYASWFGATTTIQPANYVWPLPKVESDKRVNP